MWSSRDCYAYFWKSGMIPISMRGERIVHGFMSDLLCPLGNIVFVARFTVLLQGPVLFLDNLLRTLIAHPLVQGQGPIIVPYTDLNLLALKQASDFISEHMLGRQPHWPVTGFNCARHTSGGHTRAVMEHPLAYQPFNPRAVGNEITMVFGPNSGGNLARHIIEKQGWLCVNTVVGTGSRLLGDVCWGYFFDIDVHYKMYTQITRRRYVCRLCFSQKTILL